MSAGILPSDTLQIHDRAGLERICAAHASMNSPQLPLWRAVADGLLYTVTVTAHDAVLPMGVIKRAGRPVVVVVEDDPPIEMPARSVGPDAWACATRLRYWTRSILVHGAAAEPEHYRAAVFTARNTGRLALIHTSSEHAPRWAAFLRCSHTLVLVPSAGQHPILPTPGAMQ